jgi:hypothetical protein
VAHRATLGKQASSFDRKRPQRDCGGFRAARVSARATLDAASAHPSMSATIRRFVCVWVGRFSMTLVPCVVLQGRVASGAM